jgi:hypothetical protein
VPLGDFMDPLADLIREQEWDEETARWRRKMRRMRTAFFIAYFMVSTACYAVIAVAVR